MAFGLNQVTLIGNVGRDPEYRYTNEGKEIAVFSLATTDSWRDKTSGEKRERTEWHKIVIFHEGIVNVLKNHVKKGSRLFIQGSLQNRKWTDASGNEKNSVEIVLQNQSSSLILLDSKSENQTNIYSSAASSKTTSINNGQSNTKNQFNEIDDEVPF